MITIRPRRALVMVAVLAGLTGCGGGYDWAAPPDRSKIAAQGADLPTYGLAPGRAGYGEVIKSFCAAYHATCDHLDTTASPVRQIQRFDAERASPVGTAGDIGLLWGPVAETKGVVPDYLPPAARALKSWQRGARGGWVATFAGAIAFTVNTDRVKHPPRSWSDLLRPEYHGMIAISDPRTSGAGQYMVIAAALARGGGTGDLGPGYDLFARLRRMGNLSTAAPGQETLANGTAPIQINYDFVGVAQRARLAKKVGVAVSIPADGSIWGPSALMIDKYDTAKADFLKAFLGYALSDAAQTEFARAGAHPIRYLNGDLTLPAAATRNWLPKPAYARVREIDLGGLDPLRIGRDWEAAVTAG